MSGGRPWTTSEQRALFAMRARKLSAWEIARALGRTEHAIYSFLRYVPATATTKPRMKKIEPRLLAWTQREIDTLRQFVSEGLSAADVAEALGRRLSAILTKASREKIHFRSPQMGRRPQPASKRTDWRDDAREATSHLLTAIKLAGVRP